MDARNVPKQPSNNIKNNPKTIENLYINTAERRGPPHWGVVFKGLYCVLFAFFIVVGLFWEIFWLATTSTNKTVSRQKKGEVVEAPTHEGLEKRYRVSSLL